MASLAEIEKQKIPDPEGLLALVHDSRVRTWPPQRPCCGAKSCARREAVPGRGQQMGAGGSRAARHLADTARCRQQILCPGMRAVHRSRSRTARSRAVAHSADLIEGPDGIQLRVSLGVSCKWSLRRPPPVTSAGTPRRYCTPASLSCRSKIPWRDPARRSSCFRLTQGPSPRRTSRPLDQLQRLDRLAHRVARQAELARQPLWA